MLDLLKPEISKVVDGVVGKKILIYGMAGTGKTRNAVQAPKPLVLCFENGLGAIDGVPHFTIKKWSDFRDIVKQLTNPKDEEKIHEMYETIIIDSIDGIELLAKAYVCGVVGAVSIAKGNEGYGLWKEYAQEVQKQLNALDTSGFTLIFLDHSGTRDFYDPTGAKYTKIYPAGDKRSVDPIINMCDIVGFAQFDQQVDGTPSVLSSLYVRGNSAFEAKTRFDYMPSIIPNWNYRKLTDALNAAIRENEKKTGSKAITPEQAKAESDSEKAIEEASFLSVDDEIKRIGNMLMRMQKRTGSRAEYEKILKDKLGNPDFKCNQATEEQREALDLVYNELLKLGYEYTDVIKE